MTEAEIGARFADPIRAFCRRHGASEADAADLVQQALLVTLQALREGRVRDLGRLDGFVFGTCRQLVRSLRRGAARRAAVLAALPDEGASLPVERDSREIARLERVLGAMPDRARRILLWTFCEGRSAEEIARDLGTSSENVRVIRHRSLRSLRRALGREGEAA